MAKRQVWRVRGALTGDAGKHTVAPMKRAVVLLGFLFVLGSCATTNNGASGPFTGAAFLAQSPADYEHLGIHKGAPAAWEDGMRTNGGQGSYEWWYTDLDLSDGTTIVIVFFTKEGFDVPGPSHPTVTFDATYPDGTKLSRTVQLPRGTVLTSAKDRCDVSLGDSYLRQTDTGYELRFVDKDVRFDAVMKSTLPMWRPATGHWYFGKEATDYFAWFVAQPASTVEGSFSAGGVTKDISGTGYHDHNWGNIAMNTVLNHWYWGRARIGDYTVIACDLVAEKAYGYTRLPVFMIARDGAIITDDQQRTIITRGETHQHPMTGKFMDDLLTYEQPTDNGDEYTITFQRRKDIIATSLLVQVPPIEQFFARLVGMNPTYVRILGDVTLTVKSGGTETTYTNQGLWEQMFFGSNREATINDTRGQ